MRVVIHADFVSLDGSSNWLLGLQLVGTYILISLLCASYSCPALLRYVCKHPRVKCPSSMGCSSSTRMLR